MFRDAHEYTRQCDPCQRMDRPLTSSSMPLQPILAQIPFKKWGIDFIEPIKPPSQNGRSRYILVDTEYVSKWVEAIATKNDDA